MNSLDHFVLFCQALSIINAVRRLLYNPQGDPNESIWTTLGFVFWYGVVVYACHLLRVLIRPTIYVWVK